MADEVFITIIDTPTIKVPLAEILEEFDLPAGTSLADLATAVTEREPYLVDEWDLLGGAKLMFQFGSEIVEVDRDRSTDE